MKIAVTIGLILTIAVICGRAQEIETLQYYTPRSSIRSYSDTNALIQSARFVLKRPAFLKTITVTLGGKVASGSAMVHIFGHEGGLSAPLLEKDLIEPVKIYKSQVDCQKIIINLPEPVYINNDQFFIGITDVSSGVKLITDAKPTPLFCGSTEAGQYYYQALKSKDGIWFYGLYSFHISVDVIYPNIPEPIFSKDTTLISLGSQSNREMYTSISLADIDENGFLDILTNGKLYSNLDGIHYKEVAIKGYSSCKASVFIDFNNDGLLDILCIDAIDGNHTLGSILCLNKGNTLFEATEINIPAIHYPSSISIADINSDRFPDIFIGEFIPDSVNNSVGSYLFINEQGKKFKDVSTSIATHFDGNKATCKGAGFFDYNGDTYVDLFVAHYGKTNELWINNGKGDFQAIPFTINSVDTLNYTSGFHWGYINQDKIIDFLLPIYSAPSTYLQNESKATSYIQNHSSQQTYELQDIYPFEYEEKHSGGVWGDINNDGLLDCIVTTSCPCRFADVYLQQENGKFKLATADMGLSLLSNNKDAIWADLDNDGNLDLITSDTNGIIIYRQHGVSNNNFIQLDLRGLHNNTFGIGATIEVHAGGNVYYQQVASGHGLLMQDPTRLHFGIGQVDKIDSVIVQWPAKEGTSEKFTDIPVNAVTRIVEGEGEKQDIPSIAHVYNIQTFPNPFTDEISITFFLPETSHITIAIYNAQGQTVTELFDGRLFAGTQSIKWSGKSIDDQPVPSGTYICKIEINGQSYIQHLVYIR